mgnify:CR=1 FL=1
MGTSVLHRSPVTRRSLDREAGWAQPMLLLLRLLILGIGLGLITGTALRLLAPRLNPGAAPLLGLRLATPSLRPSQGLGRFEPRQEDRDLSARLARIAATQKDLTVGAFVLVLDDGRYAELQPDRPLPAASSIKTPILLAALEAVDQGRARPDEKLPLTKTVIGGRFAKKPLELDIPIYITGMSFGALSLEAKMALAKGASMAGSATCSGEGGMIPPERDLSTKWFYQCIQSRYGFNPHHLMCADAVEFFIGQGCKVGLGGHLMGQKVTEQVAEMRSLPAGIDQRSPARHPDWMGPDDLSLKIQEIREATDYQIPIQLKLGASRVYDDVRMAAKCGPDSIYLDGADITHMPPYERPVNMMFQSYALFPHMSVADNVAYGLRKEGMGRDEIRRRVREMLDLVRLEGLDARKPEQLSGGQRQRVALAQIGRAHV